MLVYKDVSEEKGVIVAQFDSSNILESIYHKSDRKLSITFGNRLVYHYYGVENSLYEEFEKAESQGKFFNKNIKNNKDIKYQKHFKRLESDIELIKENVKKHKKY